MLLPLRFRGVAVGTLVSSVRICKSAGSGRTAIGGGDSTVKMEELDSTCVPAAEYAATVKTAPARTGSSTRSKVEI